MSAFTENLSITPFGSEWEVEAPLRWELLRKGSGLAVTVPAGFTTDLASIPWWLRWLYNPADPRYAKAVVLHDWLLVDPAISRLEAAAVFYEALCASGVSNWRAVPMALGVWAWTAYH